MAEQQKQYLISANEVANYVVCPEAWRLKLNKSSNSIKTSQTAEKAKKIRTKWKEEQELSRTLGFYVKITYLLLTAIAALVFVLEHFRSSFLKQLHFSTDVLVPDELLLLLIFLGLVIFMSDLFLRRSKSIKKKGGLAEDSKTAAIKGSETLPVKNYSSGNLGLSAQPDALVKESGKLIPVLIKPTTNKVRDRHVVELLTSLLLVEEEEKSKIPYGIILMGKDKRRVKINFSDEKRRWYSVLLDEMRSILEGAPAAPKPSYNKCKSCDVERLCDYSALRDD